MNGNGHTLLIKCPCGHCSLVHGATKADVERVEHTANYCASCGSDLLMMFRARGRYTLEEMKEKMKNG